MNEERTCRVCGSPLSASSRFCSSCGTPVDVDTPGVKAEDENVESRLIDEVETVAVDETAGAGDEEVMISESVEEFSTDAESQDESPASAEQTPESVDQPDSADPAAESPSPPVGPVETSSHDQVTGAVPPTAPQHPTFVPPAYPPPASDGGTKIWWILGGIGIFIIVVCCCIMLSVGIIASIDSALHDEFDKASYLFSSVV